MRMKIAVSSLYIAINMFILLLTSAYAHSQSFKIESVQYIKSQSNPSTLSGPGAAVIFSTDRVIQCEGGNSNKIFINRYEDSGKYFGYSGANRGTPYQLMVIMPTKFLELAAAKGAEVTADITKYSAIHDACELEFVFDSTAYYPLGLTYGNYPTAEMAFTLANPEEDREIKKIHYRLYDTDNNSYIPWVIAETNHPLVCDGKSTSLVIPEDFNVTGLNFGRVANNTSGYIEVDKQTRYFSELLLGELDSYERTDYFEPVNACLLRNPIFTFNSISSPKGDTFEEGTQYCKENPSSCDLYSKENLDEAILIAFEEGINQCRIDPASCNLYGQEDFEIATNTGKQQCIDDPSSCGLYSQDQLNNAIVIAQQQCMDHPEICGLFNQADIDNAYLSGMEKCKADPAECGLFTQVDLDQSYGAGVQFCKDHPADCGLYSQTDLNNAYHNGVQQCKDNPASCGLFGQEDLDKSLLNYRNALIAELYEDISAYKQLCKKHPDFSLCDAYDDGKGKNK